MAGIGIVQAVAVRMFYDYPKICTIGHVANFIIYNDYETLLNFIEKRREARPYADELFKSRDTKKTADNIMWSATQILKPIATNKNVCYVLGGDDFDFNLINPKNPKVICVCNDNENNTLLNGLIGSMVNILAKQINFGNRQNTFFFMDEGTTFKIPNFAYLVGLLGEYCVSFTFLTQSLSKIIEVYKPAATTSIVSNFNNYFLGRTNVAKDAKDYAELFGRIEKTKVTRSEGRSSSSRNSSTSSGKSKTEQKDFLFEPDHFTSQTQGQFTCSFLDGNYKKGSFMLKMENIPSSELENIIKPLKNNIDRIVQDFFDEMIDKVISLGKQYKPKDDDEET